MKIKLNDKNEITEYSVIGDLTDSIEINDNLKPSDFYDSFKPGYYMYESGEIVISPNYEEPTITVPKPSGPSKEWQAINMLALQVAQLKSKNGGA